jgi:hypothetical protein
MMDCFLGTYFDNVDTCDALEWELLSEIRRLKEFDDDSLASFEERWLPLRSELHRRVPNPVRSGRYRCPGIGISTLIAYQDRHGLQLMVKKRSETTVAAHPGGVHVIPSFMFQPGTSDWPEEFSIVHNILREYLEELFSVEEPGSASSARYFYGDGRMIFLRELLNRGDAQIFLSGIAVNLLTLRPEVCTVMYIPTPDWWIHHETEFEDKEGKRTAFRFCEEFEKLTHEKGPIVSNLPFNESDDELLQEEELHPNKMVPSGAAAFWLGVDVLRDALRPTQTNPGTSV